MSGGFAGLRGVAAQFFLIAALALGIGVHLLLTSPCLRCHGLLAIILPWAGAVFYAVLGGVAWRDPRSVRLSYALGLYVFIHACLVVEGILLGGLCIPCLLVAMLALSAGLRQAWAERTDRWTFASALLFGVLAALFHPLDRADLALTRRLWPSRMLDRPPVFVARDELFSCEHRGSVQIHLYEDARACESCSPFRSRILPDLLREFAPEVCLHEHRLALRPAEPQLPVVILVFRSGGLVSIEGTPDPDELRTIVRRYISRGGAAAPVEPPR